MDLRYLFAVVWILAGAACGGSSGGGSSPTAPTPVTPTASTTSQPSTWKVAGWIKAFGVGSGVQNATVRIGSTASATTDADGYFTVDVGQSGALPVVIEASGFHTSESYLDVSASKQYTHNGVTAVYAERNILASTDLAIFDLNFFDHVFRISYGGPGGTKRTERWVTIPTVEIWTQEMECVELDDSGDLGGCRRFKATTTTADNLETYVRSIVATDLPALTNNVLSGLNVTTKSHAPGTILEGNGCAEPGKIRVSYIGLGGSTGYNGGLSSSDNCVMTESGYIPSAHIVLGGMYGMTGILSTARHEFAHAVGFYHPYGAESVPRPSVMHPSNNTTGDDVTSWDKQAAIVLYDRPVGSMSPDKDRSGNTINWPASYRTTVYGF